MKDICLERSLRQTLPRFENVGSPDAQISSHTSNDSLYLDTCPEHARIKERQVPPKCQPTGAYSMLPTIPGKNKTRYLVFMSWGDREI